MRQIECPTCRAPMWEGGRCPWDSGLGCRGRLLRVNVKALGSPRTERPAKVAPERRPRAERASRPQRLRLPRVERVRLDPAEVRRRKVARSAAWNLAHRPVRPLGHCAYCGLNFETRFPSRRRYCSPRCRGRLERERKAA